MVETSFLWLEVTGRCQLTCTHCYADSGPDESHGSMTVSDWRRVLDEARDLGVTSIQFIGGEPTLYPGLVQLIDHALGKELKVEVFTNLVHVTDEMWTVFSQPGVSLATSYYSDDADEHARITGRPTYQRTRANIDEAIRRRIPIRAGVIELDPGQRSAEARAELVELGGPAIGFDRLRQVGRGVRDARPALPSCAASARAASRPFP